MHITDISGTCSLSNGVEMPYFGLGAWRSQEGQEVIDAVTYALDAGYRLIDTATIYENEAGIGKAIRQHALPRSDIFVTSKVWNTDQGYDSTIRAFEDSLQRLGFSYLDLYLIHWPVRRKYKETWRALETLYEEGRIRAIGISNFMEHHLDDLLGHVRIRPMVNQVEFHPWLVLQGLLDLCEKQHIRVESWSPLIKGRIFDIPELLALGEKYGKTAAQVVLRWNLQKGVIPIPKSINRERIIANAAVFDFEITGEDISRIDALDMQRRVGPDPDTFPV